MSHAAPKDTDCTNGKRPGGRDRSVSGGDRFLANLAYLVPGYRGYKQKGLRQDEDARLRSRVLARLAQLLALVCERRERLLEASLDAADAQLGRRADRIDTLAKAVRYAPYGFAGFFEAESVGEDTIDKILEADLLLFQELDDIIEYVRGTPFPPPTRASFQRFFETIDRDIERVERRLVARDKLLGTC